MSKNLSQSNDALQSIQNSSQNEIILYRPNDTISLNVRLENETVWLTQIQIAELFGVKNLPYLSILVIFIRVENYRKTAHIPFWNIWVTMVVKNI